MIITFSNPSVLAFFLLLPVVVGFFVWRERVRLSAVRRIGDSHLTRILFPDASGIRRFWKSALWLVAAASVVIALARPVWGIELNVIETQGVSVMVVLDVSSSMDAQDILPSRLARAKLAIRDLFEGLAGNEVGLILFAGTAFVQFPLTTDTDSAETFLNTVTTDAITRQGTAIEAALRLAVDSFEDRQGVEKIVILVTDGEDHEGDPLAAADEAASKGITIHAIGYGDTQEGAPVPVYDEAGNIVDYKRDRFGQLVVSRLNESILREITQRTGGTYHHASAEGIEVVDLVNSIRQAETRALESRSEARGVERFGIFVALALFALSLEILLPETRSEVSI